MKNVIAGDAAQIAAPTLHVGTYRRALLAVIIGNDLFTDAEQLRANHNAHECQDAQRLALWTRNVLRVAAERQALGLAKQDAAPAPAPPVSAALAATPSQCDEVYKLARHPALPTDTKAHALAVLPTLTQPQALRLIGQLWGAVLWRTGQDFAPGFTPYPA